jgi:hypothetical protein
MKVTYYMFPYDKDSVFAVRQNDDKTYSMRTWMGKYDDEYGPQKQRFDLRSSKPYIPTDDFNQLDRVLARIRANRIGEDLESVGFNYSPIDRKTHANRTFLQAGYDDDNLWVITKRKLYNDPLDCRIAIIRRKEETKEIPWEKEPHTFLRGSWRYHRYDEVKELNEDALTMIDRPTALKMALELFMDKWEEQLADFKDWCGLEAGS